MDCEHPVALLIEDEREGSIVCGVCAMVVDQLYMHNAFVDNSITSIPNISNTPFDDICANFNISNTIKHTCLTLLHTIQTLPQLRNSMKQRVQAYCLYRSLLEHNVTRSPQEIYCMTGVELSHILTIDNLVNTTVHCEYPSSDTFIERFALQCGLIFKDLQCITFYYKPMMEICENYAPQTIAAALIANYCKLHNTHSTVKFIAKQCLVSASSIYRILKHLNIDHCENCVKK